MKMEGKRLDSLIQLKQAIHLLRHWQEDFCRYRDPADLDAMNALSRVDEVESAFRLVLEWLAGEECGDCNGTGQSTEGYSRQCSGCQGFGYVGGSLDDFGAEGR